MLTSIPPTRNEPGPLSAAAMRKSCLFCPEGSAVTAKPSAAAASPSPTYRVNSGMHRGGQQVVLEVEIPIQDRDALLDVQAYVPLLPAGLQQFER